MFSIRKSFSAKLSFGVLILTMLIFCVSLTVLFSQSRRIIRQEAGERANAVLKSAMQQLRRNLLAIETATNYNAWLVERSFHPDSLLTFSNRIVRLNPHIDGCSISAEPNMFPRYGRYFSAYTIREGEALTTVIEQPYEYFTKVWYKSPRVMNAPSWEAYIDEVDSLDVVLKGALASYGRPLYRSDSICIGVISSDLSLLRLARTMNELKPYPKSYFMMVDENGRYLIHPDSTRLFNQTIFRDANPSSHADIIALGHEMTEGCEGHMVVNLEGESTLVCYQPVPGTLWSLAIVCPESVGLAGYHRLFYFIVIPLFIIGLVIIVVLCNRTVAHAIHPLNELLSKTQEVISGNMEVYIPHSHRPDIMGRLQNSFATMLNSLKVHMGSVRYANEQARLLNEELSRATDMAVEADHQKSVFIQNVSHQIRTPLNIIMGFSQVLSDTSDNATVLSAEEQKNIIDTMNHNSRALKRMVLMLIDSSDTGRSEELNDLQTDMVSCNEVARKAIYYTNLHYPDIHVELQTFVGDLFTIQTSELYLLRSLRELLFNAAEYSDGQHITIIVSPTDTTVRFIIQDTGKGIAKADRDAMFEFFTKVDDLTEGLGLGLPLTKRHAVNLGGDLFLDDEYTEGCRFIFELPL